METITARHQADHSPLSNTNIQNEWNNTSICTMPYTFMVEAHLHLLLLLSIESINHAKCLHRLQIAKASCIHKTAQYRILISPVDYTSHDDALG